ncbi:MAG: hypothetical protein JWP57_2356, partial [Spirosoma sp.]|nr:hypothetical protein [Spirosoma sp.]
AVTVHDVHHKHGSIRGTQLLNQGQNFFGRYLFHDVVVERHLLACIQGGMLIKSAVSSVMANGSVDQDGPEPGFER